MGAAVFFPDHGGNYAQGRQVCEACPVRLQCAQASRDEEYGLWDGMSPAQREAVARLVRTG
jgi:hypothetical protein